MKIPFFGNLAVAKISAFSLLEGAKVLETVSRIEISLSVRETSASMLITKSGRVGHARKPRIVRDSAVLYRTGRAVHCLWITLRMCP